MRTNLLLLAGATALGSMAAPALAAGPVANVYPVAKLRANGASTIANVLVQELNCYGGTINPLGLTSPSTKTLPNFKYTPATPAAANPIYDCATQHIQPNIDAKYVSGKSVEGRTNWANANAAALPGNPFGPWTSVHFAFADSIDATTLATYNTNAKPTGGAGIQIPFYVTPIAVAYSATYGKVLTASGVKTLSFNVKKPRPDGGLKLSEKSLCGIFTGGITNWNDPQLQTDNGGQSLASPDDDATRWSTTGVPIVLVGRGDVSGATNIFTRHLAAVCTGSVYATQGGGADLLPSGLVGNAVYDRATGNLTGGTQTPGKFGKATSSDGVAHAVDVAIADPATIGEYRFNGRIGYIGADWVKPSVLSGTNLLSADLQNGTDKKYYAPSAKNAALASSTRQPPQSAPNGKYDPTATGSGGDRADPLQWVEASNDLTGYAKPVKGYPAVGTISLLIYSCYADPAVRNAVQGLVLEHFGKIATDSTGAKIPPKLTSNVAPDFSGAPLGILARNGIASLNAAWSTAILETFATKVTTGQNPGALNLWIQDIQPKSTAQIATAKANPKCAVAQGGDGTYPGI